LIGKVDMPVKNAADVNDYRAVRRVLWAVLIANLAVTVTKIILGLVTGALAVVADGFHSLVDSSSNLIGLAAIRLASRPADERHPYGYARYETLGSLAIGGMLLAAAWEIGNAIVDRFLQGGAPNITPLAFWLIALTFPVNLAIVILETRAGKRYNSEILLADATHTRTDLFVTGSVIASVAGVWLGWRWLDMLVASAVVLLILRAAFHILKNTAGWLADASVIDPEKIEEIAQKVEGVWYVHRARSRGAPAAVFVDLHVKVYPGMSTDQAHAIASEVEERVKATFPNVLDVLVHIEPGKIDPAQMRGVPREQVAWQQIAYDTRHVADGMGLGIHDLHISQDHNDQYHIELHIELKGDVSLEEAHNIANVFESRVQERWPQTASIITHLEPLADEVQQPASENHLRLREQIRAYLENSFGTESILEVHARQMRGHYTTAIRLGLPGEVKLDRAHGLAEQVERDLIAQIPELDRVTVHMEPRWGRRPEEHQQDEEKDEKTSSSLSD
jgi:cation diffusion facilitator family transporter